MRIRKAGVLARLPGLRPQGRATTQHLRSVYWDTPAHDLAADGLGLRIRDAAGTFIQTLKSQDIGGGLVSDRAEDEAVRKGADRTTTPDLSLVADKALRRRARNALGKASVRPLFESVITRTQRIYETEAGDRFAVVLDEGYVALVEATDSRVPVCEIEIERITGSPAALFRAARALAARYPMSLGARSKAARGYMLASCRDGGAVPVTPSKVIEKAGKSSVLPGMTLPQVYAVTLTRGVNQIVGNLEAVTEHRFPDGIHQMRVTIRRLRAAVSAFHKVIPLAGTRSLFTRMKALFSIMGTARDLDVFCTETLPGMVATCADAGPGAAPDMVALAAAAEELRRDAWSRVLAAVRAPEFTQMLLEAGELAIAAGHATLDDRGSRQGRSPARFARTRLEAQWQEAVISHHDLAGLSNDERHELRKQLKKLRYEAEFFAPLWPAQDIKPFMRRMKRVQDEFGLINDVATATRLALRAADAIGGERAREAAGFVGGWHAAHGEAAFRQVVEMWPDFETLKGFWHGRPL